MSRTPEQVAADEALTAVGVLHRDSDVPIHRALGLAEYAATRLRKRLTSDED